jgi:acyl carrier protein
LRAFLAGRLADYMVPAYYVQLAAIPLTPNGKIDRKALPEPELGLKEGDKRPINQTQKEIIEIWAALLGVEPGAIGIHTNFFDVGGNSMSLIRALTRINKRFNVKLSVAEMFKLPTVSQITKRIRLTGETQPERTDSGFEDSQKQKDEVIGLFNQIRD